MVLLLPVAFSQDYRGRVQGTIYDPAQAAVAGAKVTLKNTGTGVENITQTSDVGHYLFDLVLPGSYSVTVEATGFSRFVQENVNVLTRGDVTVNGQLAVGGLTQTVNITEAVGGVEFNTSTMTTTVQGK